MHMVCVRIFLIFLINIIFNAYAYCHSDQAKELIRQAIDDKLYNDIHWLKLLHYEKGRSKIKTKNFFLSKAGHTDPKSELIATIDALLEKPISNINKHSRCRYIARHDWLKKRLVWPGSEIPERKCTDYKKWEHNGNIESISLFFATGYLENPASFFGHILIRFNDNSKLSTNDLLATSLDYGAITPEGEHPVVYILKGLFGGYEAGFSDSNYYRHNYNYGENQLRDLWEYELNLSPEQIRLLVSHSWELMPQKFTYYFTIENCASAIADLLSLVYPELDVYSKSYIWNLPLNIFNDLHNKNKESMIFRSAKYHPSRQTRFHFNYKNLSNEEKIAFDERVKYNNSNSYSRINTQSKTRVLVTLLDYYQMLLSKEYNSEDTERKKVQILLERMKLPKGKSQIHDGNYANKKPAHKGAKPSMFRIQFSHGENHDSTIFRYRPVQFDVLSLEHSRPKHSDLAVMDTSLELRNNQLKLKNLDILNIRSINPSSTNLPGDRPVSWQLKLNYGEKNFRCSDCNLFRLSGGIGKAWSLNNVIFYTFFTGQFQSEYKNYANFSLLPSIGITHSYGKRWKLMYEYKNELNEWDNEEILNIQARYQINRNLDIRLEYKKLQDYELKSGVSFYW